MLHKSFEIIESKTDQEAGTFEALVSVFGNVDRGGDRVLPGAFTKTLERWRATGDPIPVILSHQWDNPMAHIGIADPYDVVETEKGLRVKARLDVEDNDVARQVYKLLKRRSLKEFSFGYDVPQGGQKRSKDGANDLSELNLVEVGPTLKGMNDATELYAVKSALGVPRSSEDLRHAAAVLEREETEPSPTPERVPDTREQREKATRVAAAEQREREQAIIPEDVEPIKPDPGPDLHAELEQVKSALAEVREALAALAKTDETAPDPQDLRRRAEQTRREQEAGQLPTDLPEQAEADEAGPDGGPKKTPEALDTITNPDQSAKPSLDDTIKAEVAKQVQQALDAQQKADVTGKGHDSARSVDPLRQQADSFALEFASGGLSLRKPPRTVTPPAPELVPLGELKQRMRDEMLRHLSEDQAT